MDSTKDSDCEEGSQGSYTEFTKQLKAVVDDPKNLKIEVSIDRNYQIKKAKPESGK